MPSNNRRVRIDFDSPEPRYLQLAELIRTRIHDGRYRPGTAIPSIERLRQELGLSVMTIRKAVKLLAAEGQVRVVPGKGTYVTGR